MIRSARAITLLVLLHIFRSLYPGQADAGTVTGTVVVGFDSYTENYSVIQTPTFDRLSEFRTRINLSYLQGELLKDYLRIEGHGLIGQESMETVGRASLVHRFGASRVAVDNTISLRSYRSNSAYSFANDFIRYNLRAQFRRQVAPGISFGVTDRMEIVDFHERTEFDYDYVRNGIELAANWDRGFTSGYRATVGYIRKSVPDSTEIGYNAYAGGLEYRHTFGLHRQIFLTIDGQRRIYGHEPTRSPFWSLYSNANVQPFTRGHLGLALNNILESYQYDHRTGVFFDYVENRSAVQCLYFYSSLLTIGAGPACGFLKSGESGLDEYTEIGGKFSVDYNSGRRLWLSASYESGRRDYSVEGVNNTEAVFSDFVYHRVLVFTSLRLWRNASINVFANIEPEDHKIEADDTTTTLLSTDISYSF